MRPTRKRTNFPQLRNFTGERRPPVVVNTDRRPRLLPAMSGEGGNVPPVWIAVGAAFLLLLMVVFAPMWLPAVSLIIPDRYIMAYAPEPIQHMVFQIDVDEKVPTPSAPQGDDQASELLAQLAPTFTPTPTPTMMPAGPITYVQPTAAVFAPTATFTPVFSVDVDPNAVDRNNEVDLSEAVAVLEGFSWEQQGLNNCGPASIRVLMSYWDTKYGGAKFTEAQAASFLKPSPEDPNVRPDEIATFVEQYGYHGLVRESGSLELVKTFILAGYPVLIETGYDPEPTKVGWTSHYLTIVGYTDDELIAMDTYRRPNWGYPYNEIDHYWRQFNRRYIIIYRPEQAAAVASIIGENMDDTVMLENALEIASSELRVNQSDAFAWFNLGTVLAAQGRYEDAAAAFDEARRQELPWRMLWYQFAPYETYLQVGRYDDVIDLADSVLAKKRSEEAYYYKGLALEQLGETANAMSNIRLALDFNKNFELAKLAMERLEDKED